MTDTSLAVSAVSSVGSFLTVSSTQKKRLSLKHISVKIIQYWDRCAPFQIKEKNLHKTNPKLSSCRFLE